MRLVPIRLTTIYSCPIHSIVQEKNPGRCPIDQRELVRVTVQLTFTCPATPEIESVEPGKCADGSPMAYEIGFYPAKLFPGLLGRELGTLYDVFASEYDVVVTSGEQTVRADNADGHVARILGVARRAPLLVLERTTFAGRRVVELSWSAYRADRYRLHMALTPRGPRTS